MTEEEHNLLRKCVEKLDYGHKQLDRIAQALDEHIKSDQEMFFGSKDYEGSITTLKIVKSRLFFLTSIAGALLSAVLLYFLKTIFV